MVSQSTYDLVSHTVPRVLKQAAAFADRGGRRNSARDASSRAGRQDSRTTLTCARSLVEVYRPYIQDLVYTFHGRNIRELYATLGPADAERHPFRPEKIDWRDYWINVHLPGLRRHIFPQLDLHTRGRPQVAAAPSQPDRNARPAADRYGSRVALMAHHPSGEQTSLTYRELRDRAHRAALMLGNRGIKPGDRVLLIGENSPDWVVGYFAILYAGAVAVPLDQLISADELAPICKIAEPRAALLSEAVHRRLG